MSRPVGPVMGVVALTLAIAGCRGDVIDDGKAEDFIGDGLEERVGVEVSAVDCPSDVDVEKGKTFECAASTGRGRFAVTIRMTDDEGTIVPVRARRAK